jgi:hypothetical protein
VVGFEWPKNLRVLAREGFEGDGVIIDFTGDVVDLGLDRTGAVIRAPEGPAGDGAQLRAAMAKQRSILRRIWDAL